jgi:hypothetical protein
MDELRGEVYGGGGGRSCCGEGYIIVQYTAFRIRYEVVVVIDDVLSGFIQA